MSAQPQMTSTGPVPPRDFDAEQATLGSMLLSQEAALRVFTILQPEDFYWENHRAIYQAARACSERHEPVDLITVSAELRRRKLLEQVGGGTYLTALMGTVPTAAHVLRYANTVEEKAYLREVIVATGAIQELAYSNPENPLDTTNAMMEQALAIHRKRVAEDDGLRTWAAGKERVMAIAREAVAGRKPLSVQRLGIDGLDDRIGPLADHRLVLIKGGSGSGKTHLIVNAAMATAMELSQTGDERRVCIFSTESPGMYDVRGLAWASGVNSMDIRRGFSGERRPEQAEILLAVAEAMPEQLPLSIEEGEVTEEKIEADLRRHASEHGIAMVCLDYWQDIHIRPGRTRVEEFVNLAARMKHICQDELQVPFLIASQMSYNQGTGEWQAKESTKIQDSATLTIRLQRDKKNREKYSLVCEKDRIGIEFGELPIRMDKATSHIHLIAESE